MTTSPCLLCEDRDGVRTFTLNRPDKRNALNTPLIESLLAAIEAADADERVGAMVLAGAGTLFCAGADIGEFHAAGGTAEASSDHRSDLFTALFVRFGNLRRPVLAAVEGAALGAGAALALAADMVVLDAGARFGYPETPHGMIPSLMVPSLLSRVPRAIAFELLVTGEPIPAERAYALGIVNRIVPGGTALAVAHGIAARLAGLDRYVVAGTKRVLDACVDLPLDEALREGRAVGRWLKAERH